ncbi:MAG TPA: hypothetical protein VMU81_27900 [Acetobacteraceae bacterium]|nr:hypothetical protein [Acetobacteraceae bacterium]
MSRPPRQDRRLVKVLAALRTHGGPGRSPLYRWMRRHHDTLATAFAETPPAWGPLATELAAVGLTDADGNPPAAASARQTWYRVRRDVARARGQRDAKPPALAPDEIAPAVHAVVPPAADGGHDAAALPRPRMALDIRPVRAATAAPSPAATDAPGTPGIPMAASATAAADTGLPTGQTPGVPATATAAEQGRRLLATMEAGKVPLPKVM